MFDNFIQLNIMFQEEVDSYITRVGNVPNIHMDDNMDYLETFNTTDVLIADVSSINYEFYLSGKPIIFCGNVAGLYNDEMKKMLELIYKVSNWEELKCELDKCICGNDINKDKRLEDIKKSLEMLPDNIGKTIVDKCYKIARGESY